MFYLIFFSFSFLFMKLTQNTIKPEKKKNNLFRFNNNMKSVYNGIQLIYVMRTYNKVTRTRSLNFLYFVFLSFFLLLLLLSFFFFYIFISILNERLLLVFKWTFTDSTKRKKTENATKQFAPLKNNK